jgi:phospholipase/carboxylesterase
MRAAFLALAMLACDLGLECRQEAMAAGPHEQGLLEARPHAPSPDGTLPGEQRLGVSGGKRDGLLLVPAAYRPEQPAPLVVLLHGAGARAEDILPAFRAIAERLGIILLVPSSVGPSWDAIVGDYGPDVRRLDAALQQVFDRYAVDPKRIGVAGFSDGASYALSLGVSNGTLFTHILAFSPGFMAPTTARGRPKIFISHGVEDTVLPIERCSRRIVPLLRADHYDVDYREFAGGHAVPPALAEEAFQEFAGTRAG